jgi:hypothetical protein
VQSSANPSARSPSPANLSFYQTIFSPIELHPITSIAACTTSSTSMRNIPGSASPARLWLVKLAALRSTFT